LEQSRAEADWLQADHATTHIKEAVLTCGVIGDGGDGSQQFADTSLV